VPKCHLLRLSTSSPACFTMRSMSRFHQQPHLRKCSPAGSDGGRWVGGVPGERKARGQKAKVQHQKKATGGAVTLPETFCSSRLVDRAPQKDAQGCPKLSTTTVLPLGSCQSKAGS